MSNIIKKYLGNTKEYEENMRGNTKEYEENMRGNTKEYVKNNMKKYKGI